MHTMLAAALLVLAADPVKYELEGNALKVPSAIVFDTAKASLKPESDAALDFVKNYLDAKKAISTLRIEVHSDNAGDAKAAQALTEARAAAVFEALVKRGADCKRLIAVGFGPNKPIAANDTPEGKAQNRRVEFINAGLLNRPIGGMPLDGGGVVAPTKCN